MSVLRVLVLSVALLALALPMQAQAQSMPEEWQCVLPDYPALFNELREIECGVGKQAWEYAWYYPPGPYQVWCHLTYDCPCPQCPAVIPW